MAIGSYFEVFSEVAKQGSFARAAESLRLTPSAVSHAISSFEQELGFRLFSRSRSGAELTEEGKLVLEHVRAILDRAALLEEDAERIRGLTRGRVNIGTFSSVLVSWLTEVIGIFRRAYPEIEINVSQGDYADVETWVKEGDCEIGFSTLPAGDEFRTEVLARDRLMLAAPKDYVPENGRAVTVSELRRMDLIFRREGYNRDAEAYLAKWLPDAEVHFHIDDDRSIFALIEAEMGAAILPELTLSHRGFDVSVWPLEEPSRRTIVLLVRRDRILSPAASRFVETLKEWLDGKNR